MNQETRKGISEIEGKAARIAASAAGAEQVSRRHQNLRKSAQSAAFLISVISVFSVVNQIGGSELLDLAAAGFQQGEKTIRAGHVTRADHDEIRLAAAEITIDFRKPVLVARVDQASGQ